MNVVKPARMRDVNIQGVLKAENYRENEWEAIVARWHPLFRNIASIIVSSPAEKRKDVKDLLMVLNTGEDMVNEKATQFALDMASLSDESLQRLSFALHNYEKKEIN